MQPKLFKTTIAQYVPASWNGKNESGINPLGDRVLVKPDRASDVTTGGIVMPDDITERHTMAAEAGVFIASGDGAFKWNSDKMTPFEGKKPKAGDRVCIEKYSGALIKGDDGEMYRLMEAYCIGAIITPEKKSKAKE